MDLKLVGVAAMVSILALGERLLPTKSGGMRFVLAGSALIGLAGLVATLVNVGAALSLR